VNCCVPPMLSVALGGTMKSEYDVELLLGGGLLVTVTCADPLTFEVDVA